MTAKKSPSRNYACLQKGIGVGSNVHLTHRVERRNPRENLFCGMGRTGPLARSRSAEALAPPSGKKRGDPYNCFKKGFHIGKVKQGVRRGYRVKEGIDGDVVISHETTILVIAVVIGLVVFGLLYITQMHWAWALLVGAVMAVLFWYFCRFCD